jgi:hypothetical protein
VAPCLVDRQLKVLLQDDGCLTQQKKGEFGRDAHMGRGGRERYVEKRRKKESNRLLPWALPCSPSIDLPLLSNSRGTALGRPPPKPQKAEHSPVVTSHSRVLTKGGIGS